MLILATRLLLFTCAVVQASYNHDHFKDAMMELVGDQMCCIYRIVEEPKLFQSYFTENKIVTLEECGETLTITNAPTHYEKLVTYTYTIDPCIFPQTSTQDRCHSITEVIETIIPCAGDGCIAKTLRYTITKAWEGGYPTGEPHGDCYGDQHCSDGQCCGEDYQCGYGSKYCGTGCRTNRGAACHPEAIATETTTVITTETTTLITTETTQATPTPSVLPIIACGPDAENPICPLIIGTDGFRLCCGPDDICGLGPEFCQQPGCQPEFGDCYPEETSTETPQLTSTEPPLTIETPSPSLEPTTSEIVPQPTPTGLSIIACGPDAENPICPLIPGTDGFRLCCGPDDICGLGPEFCQRPGCQPEFGDCYPEETSTETTQLATTEPLTLTTEIPEPTTTSEIVPAPTTPPGPEAQPCFNAFACGALQNCGINNECFCFQTYLETTDGFCTGNFLCADFPTCVADADCEDNHFCLSTCCPTPSCSNPASFCPNPITPRLLFKLPDESGREPWTGQGVRVFRKARPGEVILLEYATFVVIEAEVPI